LDLLLCEKEHHAIRGVIGEVRCGFLQIYAPTSYSAVFLLHAPALASIKIGFGAVRFGLVRCGVSAVFRFGLNSFGSDWTSSNVNFNLKSPPLQQLKNLANYNIQI
jgi:hypothetical protein